MFLSRCLLVREVTVQLINFATDEIAMRIGDLRGGLVTVTFGIASFYHRLTFVRTGNAVEFIVSILALIQGQVGVVQAALLGSMLSSLLLATGLCFFSIGLKHYESAHNLTVFQP